MTQEKNKTDDKGNEHGYWEIRQLFVPRVFPHKIATLSKGNYVHGNKEGLWIYFAGMYGESIQYDLTFSKSLIIKATEYKKDGSIQQEIIMI